MNLNLTFLMTLNYCIAWAILRAFVACERLSCLDKAMWATSRVHMTLLNLRRWACMVHHWSSSLWSFFAYSWDADSSNFRSWPKDTSYKFLWICSSFVRAFLDAGCLITNSGCCFLWSNSASWVWTKMFNLSYSSTPAIWPCWVNFHVIKDNTCDIA